MRRREFLIGAGAAAWPLTAGAQQPAMPIIGFMSSRSATDSDYLVAAFLKGLNGTGYYEGKNVAVAFRWANGRYDELPRLAEDLLTLRPTVFVAVGGEPSALAAKAATTAIPIVFTIGGDPMKVGLVASMNRPGGNATGVSLLAIEPEAKRLGMFHEIVPPNDWIGALVNPSFSDAKTRVQELTRAAGSLGRKLEIFEARNDPEIELAFAKLARTQVKAVLVTADPFFDSRRDRIIAFAAQTRLPTIYQFREYAEAGGLMSYGISITEGYHQAGVYTGQILKGANPAQLPVHQSIKFELVINLKTAKLLGAEIPSTLLALADAVIE
jgi:putative ABC transport system substrate-binding protein